ncbi:MAG: carbohydrate-binding domain-containing protein, partial [Lachnospiraceae bacterium]|nr:carbohydrate-binding domain-containing protein [Lachnospiraceae bacterium]
MYQGNITYCFTANTEPMTYADSKTLTIQGATFDLTDITGMEVVAEEFDDNTVLVEYNETIATVTIAGNIAQYVNAELNGSHVTINQSSDVSDSTCGEITYILKGSTSSGSFVQNGSYKSTIELQGLTMTNPTGAAIDIQNGKRIELSAKNSTVNTIIDGSNGSQKAALYCKGHLELKGKGTLNVTGNTGHGISAKEYIEMKNLTLNILEAVKDGINCNQYFLMESGTINISGTGDDGIQVSYKDDTDREAEDTGTMTIKGGSLNISVTADAAKALKADNDIIVAGGT